MAIEKSVAGGERGQNCRPPSSAKVVCFFESLIVEVEDRGKADGVMEEPMEQEEAPKVTEAGTMTSNEEVKAALVIT